jgi:hypothetical protein
LKIDAQRVKLNGARRLGVVLVPWSFVVCLGALYAGLLVPRLMAGHWLAVVLAVLGAVIVSVFVVAAITFSRDVLVGRWP